jgi:hypothetical protein
MIRRKKMLTIIITTIFLLICFFVGLYILGIKSEPYQFALDYIDNNETIAATIGQLKSRRLSFWGYSVHYSGPRGRAEYKILVKGERDNGEVYIDLKKSTGQWSVLKAKLKLNNKPIINLLEEIG